MSCSISLTDNHPYNGSLMIMPGSQKTFVSCVGRTPDHDSVSAMADRHGIAMMTGKAGSATFFDSNCMHGSGDNITPYSRSNIFLVFNSVANPCTAPYYAPTRRPEYIGARDFRPIR